MGTQRPTAQVVRRDLSGLALPRVCSTPHNIGGLPPYSDLAKNSNPLTSSFFTSRQSVFSTDG